MKTIFDSSGKKDRIFVEVKDKYGKTKSAHWINEGKLRRFLIKLRLRHNSMTNDGFVAFVQQIGGIATVPAVFNSIGIGTNSSPAAGPTNTQLGTSIKVKTATTIVQYTTSVTNDTLKLVATFSNALDSLTGTSAIVEIGMFNGNLNGTSKMALRQVYTPADSVNFDQGDTITVTILMQEKQGV